MSQTGRPRATFRTQLLLLQKLRGGLHQAEGDRPEDKGCLEEAWLEAYQEAPSGTKGWVPGVAPRTLGTLRHR